MITAEIEGTQEYDTARSIRVEKYRVTRDGITIDTERPIASADEAESVLGIHSPIVGGIRASLYASEEKDHVGLSETEFLVMDNRKSAMQEAPFLLLGAQGVLQIHPGQDLHVGRMNTVKEAAGALLMSRNHFYVNLSPDGTELKLYDDDSTNGTFFSGYAYEKDLSDVNRVWSRFTQVYADEAEASTLNYRAADERGPYGFIGEHPIIGRQSPSVHNGIYGSRKGEQILIDDDSVDLDLVKQRIINSLPSSDNLSPRSILTRVKDGVAEVLRYDLAQVLAMNKEALVQGYNIIPLSEYLREGVGVCRHQAMLSAVVIEEAIKARILDGTVHLERNQDLELEEAHAWSVYYDNRSHEEIIVDAAQDFVGSREEAKQQGRWKYYTNPIDG